jgi:hypothetical protein
MQILPRVVVPEDRPVEVGLDGQVTAVGAKVAAGSERGVVDVVGVLAVVAVGVLAPPGPGRGDELHRADRTVVRRVAVVRTVVGVRDVREADAVEDGTEDRRERGAVGVHLAAARLS